MKRLIIFCFIICSLTSVAAANADARYPVYLDLSTTEKTDNSENPKTPEKTQTNIQKGHISTTSQYKNIDITKKPNLAKNFSVKKEKKFGKKSAFGVKYDTEVKPELTAQSRTLYTNHNLTDRLSLSSSYKTNPLSSMSEQMKGVVSVSPELKLTDKAALKSIYSKNIAGNSYTGEFQFKYKPFRDGRMDMNIGAGQTVYDDSRETSTKVNFGTNISF